MSSQVVNIEWKKLELWQKSKPDQSEPNQSEPNQSDPNQSKPNLSDSNQRKPNQSKPNQSNWNFLKSPRAPWSYFFITMHNSQAQEQFLSAWLRGLGGGNTPGYFYWSPWPQLTFPICVFMRSHNFSCWSEFQKKNFAQNESCSNSQMSMSACMQSVDWRSFCWCVRGQWQERCKTSD